MGAEMKITRNVGPPCTNEYMGTDQEIIVAAFMSERSPSTRWFGSKKWSSISVKIHSEERLDCIEVNLKGIVDDGMPAQEMAGGGASPV